MSPPGQAAVILARNLSVVMDQMLLANVLSDAIETGTAAVVHVESRSPDHAQMVVVVWELPDSPPELQRAVDLDREAPDTRWFGGVRPA